MDHRYILRKEYERDESKEKEIRVMDTFSGGAALTQFTVPVKASEPQIQDVNIQMVGGRFVRSIRWGCEWLPASRNHIFKSWKKAEHGKLWNRTASEKVFDRRSGIDA